MSTRAARTASLTVVPLPAYGAEDVLVDTDGSVLTGTEDGAVWRVRDAGARIERVGHTGGRPLGLEWLPDRRLLVCDARRGLLAMDVADGRVEVLTDLVHGRRMAFCNNASVAEDGTIWFSDSSRYHGLDRWRADIVENTASGRLLRRDPDGSVTVVLDGLRFANGVALAADASYVVVAELARRALVRHWLSGDRSGTSEVLVDDLPGYPDNLSLGTDGLVWVSVASPTDPVVERLMRAPMVVRRVAWKLPAALQPQPGRTVRALALDGAGAVVHDRSLAADRFHFVTGVREHAGRVWVGSLHEPAIAYFEV